MTMPLKGYSTKCIFLAYEIHQHFWECILIKALSVKTLGKYFSPLQNAVLLNRVPDSATVPEAFASVPFIVFLVLSFCFALPFLF